MDRNIYDNDFEDFLRQKSDQYKMYPSDRVWNNVYYSLHGRKRWWAFGLTVLFIGAGLFTGREVLLNNYTRVADKISDSAIATGKPIANAHTRHAFPAHQLLIRRTPVHNTSNTNMPADAVALNGRADALASSDETTRDASNDVQRSAESTEAPITINNNGQPVAGNEPASAGATNTEANKMAAAIAATATGKDAAKPAVKTPAANNASNTDAVAATAKTIKPSRWSLQFYGSPTISYRRLSSFNQTVNNPAVAVNNGNINNYVNHRPAPGFELGTNVQYRLSDNLSVFGGVQLNYSRYYINAFQYQKEKVSIAVDNAMVHDTLSGYTNIRNFNGYAPEQLQNRYLQLSLPVGVEIKLLGRKKLQFSVAGGVQPTFLLSSTTYLISSDYKNYIQSPDLARGFNVHTNFEAFISYQTGGLKWQIGPQLRTQLLSSYSNQYRVREYLTEYGIKFGVTRSF